MDYIEGVIFSVVHSLGVPVLFIFDKKKDQLLYLDDLLLVIPSCR